ncbi:sigma 54-interacting transcriptional regulator [Oceanimonas sp. NS1]|nr:sigma 54-interacting transcriptional regulator [Oceanimonas sp. NS1]
MDVDARIVAATKVDLQAAGQAGLFRPDLYFRLNVVTLHLPPLRERRADIPLLFLHFVDLAQQQYQREVAPPGEAMLQRLMSHNWPGNVRELRHAAEQYVLGVLPTADNDRPLPLPRQLAALEQQLILDAMHQADDNVALAAERLGIPARPCMTSWPATVSRPASPEQGPSPECCCYWASTMFQVIFSRVAVTASRLLSSWLICTSR